MSNASKRGRSGLRSGHSCHQNLYTQCNLPLTPLIPQVLCQTFHLCHLIHPPLRIQDAACLWAALV